MKADHPSRVYRFEPIASAPSVHVSQIDPPQIERLLEPHTHQHLEIIYFEEPGGQHRLGTETWNTEAGDLLLIAPGEVHQWDPGIRQIDPSAWIVAFTPSSLDPSQTESSLFRLVSDPLLFPFLHSARDESYHLRVPPDQRPRWSAWLRTLEQELRLQGPGYREAARAYLTILLVNVVRLAENEGRSASSEQPLLLRVFEYIEAEFRKSISLSDVARAVHLSPGHLTSTVRKKTGRTVLEWIVERRVAEARRLLLETDLSVAQIARKVGYQDATNLIRHFRRAQGITPTAWRRIQRRDATSNPLAARPTP